MTNTPISSSTPEGHDPQDRMAEILRPITPPKEGFTAIKWMKESTKYGILLFFLQNQNIYPLSEGQILWIVYRARKLSEAELLRSAKFSLVLTNSEQARLRSRSNISKLYYCVPSLDPKRLPEKRTIGIGYRDKGSLRPLHENHGSEGIEFWDEDISYLLPLSYTIEGKWISAEEVISLVGVEPLILATLQVQKQTLQNYYPWKQNTPDPEG